MSKGRRLLIPATVALVVVAGSCAKEAFQAPEEIRNEILEEVPLGSSVSEIDAFIARHGHTPWTRVLEFENPQAKAQIAFWDGPASGFVSAIVARYTLTWKTDVVAYWILDEQQRVTGLVVEKYRDAP